MKSLWKIFRYMVLISCLLFCAACSERENIAAAAEISIKNNTQESIPANDTIQPSAEYRADNSKKYYGRKRYTSLAVVLNTIGMNHYDKKEYSEAIGFFEQSIIADPLYILPHYNLACTLNLLRDSGADISVHEIVAELIITLNLKPETGGRQKGWAESRIKTDPDLQSLHHLQEFKEQIEGYRPAQVDYDIIALLCDTRWDNMLVHVSFDMDGSYSESVGQEPGYRLNGIWQITNTENTRIITYDNMESSEDLRGVGPTWPDPTPANDREYYFDIEKLLLFAEGSFFSLLTGYNDLFDDLIKNQDYGRIIQIVNLGFPVNYNYHAKQYIDEHVSYFYYPSATLFQEALFREDIPMVRLFLGYSEELSEEDENDLKEFSEGLYLSYMKVKNQIDQK